MVKAPSNRTFGALFIALMVSGTLSARANNYVSPHSWFGYPGTMLNDEKTFTIWFPANPVADDKPVKLENGTYAQKSYSAIVGTTVFSVRDYDFSGLDNPFGSFVMYLKGNGAVLDSEESNGEAQHYLRYHTADGKASMEMRTFERGPHLYTAAVVANGKMPKIVLEYSDRFLASFQPYDPSAEAK